MRIISIFISSFFFISICSFGQSANHKESEIINTVNKWCALHNSRNLYEFRNIYSSSVLFYGKYLSKEDCLLNKSQNLNSNFSLSIVSPIQIKYFRSGVVQCFFTKRVIYKLRVKEYPSYLLLEKKDKSYEITGESDLITDSKNKTHLALGPEIENKDKRSNGFMYILPLAVLIPIYIVIKKKKKTDPELPPNEIENPSHEIIVTANETPISKKDVVRKEFTTINNIDNGKHQYDDPSIKGDLFEKFILSKFPDEYYRLLEWRSDKYFEGRYPESNMHPDFVFKKETKSRSGYFAVECKWRSDFTNGKIEWANQYQLKNYKEYEREFNMRVFIMIGIGGLPQEPECLYVLPLSEVRSTMLSEYQLRKYQRRKHSDFFFDTDNCIIT